MAAGERGEAVVKDGEVRLLADLPRDEHEVLRVLAGYSSDRVVLRIG